MPPGQMADGLDLLGVAQCFFGLLASLHLGPQFAIRSFEVLGPRGNPMFEIGEQRRILPLLPAQQCRH